MKAGSMNLGDFCQKKIIVKISFCEIIRIKKLSELILLVQTVDKNYCLIFLIR